MAVAKNLSRNLLAAAFAALAATTPQVAVGDEIVLEPTSKMTAQGHFRNDGEDTVRKWTGGFELHAGGVISGSVLMEGIGPGGTMPVEGTISDGQLSFQVVSTPEGQSQKTTVATFDGTVRGVRIRGTYTSADGVPGRWSGWWTAEGRIVEPQSDGLDEEF